MGFSRSQSGRRTDVSYRNALQTVLLSVALLCVMGVICSLTTKFLHRIILWFAPINSKWALSSPSSAEC